MSIDARQLYELLPAIHRIRDLEQGKPLAALLGVISEQVALLEENLQQLYDDQFIETCADWVAPYIGDLIGYRPLHGVAPAISSPRAEVANTIRYRRRKGTASMLEQLARDVTGWNVRAVEFFEWLAWNQYLKHTRANPVRGGTLPLRDHDSCERVSQAAGAFDTSAHNVDVRRIATGGGRYGIRNVGLFIWRLREFHVVRGDARKIADGQYTFNPLGLDEPLFNLPQTENEVTHLAEERNVPGTLRRRVLFDELEAWRGALAAGTQPQSVYFGARPVFEILLNHEAKGVLPEETLICNLQSWHAPVAAVEGQRIRVAVDPVLGRIAIPAGDVVDHVQASFSYGFPDETGGGPYDRVKSIAALSGREVKWQALVSKAQPPEGGRLFATLADAVNAWNTQPAGVFGVITILDSASYVENLTGDSRIQIPGGSELLIAAQSGARPHVQGDVSVVGTAAADATNPGGLMLSGLLLEGGLTVLVGNLGGLTLSHCTAAPAESELLVNASAADDGKRNSQLAVTLERSVCGPITFPDTELALQITDSIVSNGLPDDDVKVAIDAAHANVDVVRATVFGSTTVGRLEARNSIFTGRVDAARRQTGCIGFCYLPADSRGPRRHRCQPDLEIATQIARAEQQAPLPDAARDALRATIAGRMKPTFTSRQYGAPGFGQLRISAPLQLRTGAADEAEMGAFHDLFQPQRETNLRVRLEEYLRFGFEAGVVYVT